MDAEEADKRVKWVTMQFGAPKRAEAHMEDVVQELYNVRVATARQLSMMIGVKLDALKAMLNKYRPVTQYARSMEFYANGKWSRSNHTNIYTLSKQMVRDFEYGRNYVELGFSVKDKWSFQPSDLDRAIQAAEIYAVLRNVGYDFEKIKWNNSILTSNLLAAEAGEGANNINERFPRIIVLGSAICGDFSENGDYHIWGISIANRQLTGLNRVLQLTFPKELSSVMRSLMMVKEDNLGKAFLSVVAKGKEKFNHIHFVPYEWSVDHPRALGEMMLKGRIGVIDKLILGYRRMGWQVQKLFEYGQGSADEPFHWRIESPDGHVEFVDTTYGASLAQAYELATKSRQLSDNRKYTRAVYVATEAEREAWSKVSESFLLADIDFRLINWPI